eukprot:COSAG01_NODE_17147_length_1174_cov_1.184186_1_plen_118_part_00
MDGRRLSTAWAEAVGPPPPPPAAWSWSVMAGLTLGALAELGRRRCALLLPVALDGDSAGGGRCGRCCSAVVELAALPGISPPRALKISVARAEAPDRAEAAEAEADPACTPPACASC